MPISNTAMSPTQFGGMPSPQMAGGMPQMGGGMPNINLPGIQMGHVDPANLAANPSNIYSMLSQPQQSLTQAIGPLLQQVYGAQGNLMQPIFQQQGAQGAAIAQSDAMKRGIAGSSIESAGMQQAYGQANQAYNQYISQMLSQLVPQYSGAAQFDIGQNRDYYSQLAQAMGQERAQDLSQQMFYQQKEATSSAADKAAKAQMWASVIHAIGMIGGGAAAGKSDIRLKEDVRKIGEWRGLGIFKFRYRQDKGISLPEGEMVGLMAHEVAREHPEVVSLDRGYLQVDYKKLFALEACNA